MKYSAIRCKSLKILRKCNHVCYC